MESRERMFMNRNTWIGMVLVYTTTGEVAGAVHPLKRASKRELEEDESR